MTAKISGQAKAIAAAVAVGVAVTQSVAASKGYVDPTQFTLAEWLDALRWTLLAYAGIYMIPNRAPTVPAEPAPTVKLIDSH